MTRPEGNTSLLHTLDVLRWNWRQAADAGEDAACLELNEAIEAVKMAAHYLGHTAEEIGD